MIFFYVAIKNKKKIEQTGKEVPIHLISIIISKMHKIFLILSKYFLMLRFEKLNVS